MQTEFCGLTKQTRQEIENLTETKALKNIDSINYITEILKCIEQVKTNKDSIYIKLNKNLILHSQNSVSICDNLNIQIAKQIHLNPIVKLFKKIQGAIKGTELLEEKYMGGK